MIYINIFGMIQIQNVQQSAYDQLVGDSCSAQGTLPWCDGISLTAVVLALVLALVGLLLHDLYEKQVVIVIVLGGRRAAGGDDDTQENNAGEPQ